MSEELSKAYDPSGIEPKGARLWVERELYRASSEPSSRPTFSIAIPPPNVTGSLHMGHMLEHALIDAMVRWKRMRGHNVLWLPGTDHAGFGFQARSGEQKHDQQRQERQRRAGVDLPAHGM